MEILTNKSCQGGATLTVSVLWVIISSLLSGLIGVLISLWAYRRYEKRQQKFDTLRRLCGYRYALDPVIVEAGEATGSREDFFSALNEVVIVFHDMVPVIEALEKYKETMKSEELVTLLKTMCAALNVSYELNDSFLFEPFYVNMRRSRK